MPNEPWYAAGLRFQCTGCGNCCTGAPGHVWVNQAEIEALAAHLGTTIDEFEARYVRPVGIRRSLVEFPNGDCAASTPCGRGSAAPGHFGHRTSGRRKRGSRSRRTVRASIAGVASAGGASTSWPE